MNSSLTGLLRNIDRSKSRSFKPHNRSSLSASEADSISYNNVELLKKFVSEGGRILPRRITNLSCRLQRKVKKSIKRARLLALMPFSDDTTGARW